MSFANLFFLSSFGSSLNECELESAAGGQSMAQDHRPDRGGRTLERVPHSLKFKVDKRQ